jgi:RND family efflux transporter MFP subunit
MDERNIETNEPEEIEKVERTDATGKSAWRQKPMIIAASILAIVLLGAVVLLWLRFDGGEAGKPVPAPRSVTLDDSASGDGGENLPAGQTITIPAEQIEAAGIKIVPVGEQLTTETIAATATGVVQANAYRETPVVSLVGGVVRRVAAELGETVAAGQTVAVIFSNELAETQSRYVALLIEAENARRNYERTQRLVAINQPGRTEYDQAEKQLRVAEAELDEHHRHHERTEKLVRIGASSREEFEQATTKLRTAEAELKEARLRFERARQLLAVNPQTRAENEEALNKLRRAEAELAAQRQKLVLYGMSPQRISALRTPAQISSEIAVAAPVSGTITARAVNPGEVVEANKELLRVTNLSDVWVVAQVFEPDLARIRAGSGASVTTEAFPDRIFRGAVTYIDPSLDEATRTARVRVELENPDRLLKIGMYVRVAFGALGGQAERTAPSVPAAAVQTIGNRQVVFVAATEPNVFELRPVRLGAELNGQYTILEGLSVGERVVAEGSFLLRAEWLKTNAN